MRSKNILTLLSGIIFLFYGMSFAKKDIYNFKYHSPREANKVLEKLAKSNGKFTKIHKISVSRSGEDVNIIEIGNEVRNRIKKLPAILVVANLEGINPLATEAALYLAKLITENPNAKKTHTWYILPVGNPDAALRFFSKPLYSSSYNATPVNDDMDDAIDEDGYDDLDRNGIITKMRVKDPSGTLIPVKGEPRLMKRADWKKGEKGIYKLYSEGLDNDGDGKYNEDIKGGVDLSKQFPHLFKHFKKGSGLWPGSEKTIFNLFKFVFVHNEIAMTMNFNNTNFLLQPPQSGRRGKVDYDKIKVPKRLGKRMGFDTSRTYSMKEIMEKVKEILPPGMQVSESMIAGFLGLGAVINPIKSDLDFYGIISKDYKKFLKDNKFEPKRFEPKKSQDGSFELWSYYHLGLPSFTMDFWTIPKIEEKGKKKPAITAEKLEKMTKDEFLALGKDKIQSFLKASGAPKNIKAEMLIKAVKGGMMTPKRMAGMMKRMSKSKKDKDGISAFDKAFLAYNDKVLKGKGFVNWKKFRHPTLGTVEIGGRVPFATTTPPQEEIEHLLKAQLPYILKLKDKLPIIKIRKTMVKNLGAGVYEVKAWVENRGIIPYPTAMGRRNRRITPLIISISGKNIKILEGTKRMSVKGINGLQTKMVKWLIYSENPTMIKIKSFTRIAGSDYKTVQLGGKK